MATDLGKVGIVMKGDWDSSATYEVLDAVSDINGLYIAKQNVPANTSTSNTTYWQLAITNIKTDTYNATSDANGLIITDIQKSTKNIISAKCDAGGVTVNTAASSTGLYWFYLWSASTGTYTPAANRAVVITYQYI